VTVNKKTQTISKLSCSIKNRRVIVISLNQPRGMSAKMTVNRIRTHASMWELRLWLGLGNSPMPFIL